MVMVFGLFKEVCLSSCFVFLVMTTHLNKFEGDAIWNSLVGFHILAHVLLTIICLMQSCEETEHTVNRIWLILNQMQCGSPLAQCVNFNVKALFTKALAFGRVRVLYLKAHSLKCLDTCLDLVESMRTKGFVPYVVSPILAPLNDAEHNPCELGSSSQITEKMEESCKVVSLKFMVTKTTTVLAGKFRRKAFKYGVCYVVTSCYHVYGTMCLMSGNLKPSIVI